MQVDKVILGGKELAMIDASFAGIRPTHRKEVIVNFTDGKEFDTRWAGAAFNAWAITPLRTVQVNNVAKTCGAVIVVDLFEVMGRAVHPATPHWQLPRTLTPDYLRLNIVRTIVHELAHVAQGWQIGKRFTREVLDSHPTPDDTGDPIALDIFARTARNFTERWWVANGDDVPQGRFDFVLPVSTLRGVMGPIGASAAEGGGAG